MIADQNIVSELEATINSSFPDFAVQDIQSLGEGWSNRTVLVNGEWVFRFPKDEDSAKDLRKEIALLPRIAPSITIAIPNFEYAGTQQNGYPFVGYKQIPGTILGEHAFGTLAPAEQRTLAKSLAQFMNQLHAFPADEALKLGVPNLDAHSDYAETYEDVKQKVFPLLDDVMQRRISDDFNWYLSNNVHFAYQLTLIHADLSPDHYLLDANKQLTGIIDFGDMHVGDPDLEYLYILDDCGEAFMREIMTLRGEEVGADRMRKISFFAMVDNVGIVLEGIARRDQAMIKRGIENIY